MPSSMWEAREGPIWRQCRPSECYCSLADLIYTSPSLLVSKKRRKKEGERGKRKEGGKGKREKGRKKEEGERGDEGGRKEASAFRKYNPRGITEHPHQSHGFRIKPRATFLTKSTTTSLWKVLRHSAATLQT